MPFLPPNQQRQSTEGNQLRSQLLSKTLIFTEVRNVYAWHRVSRNSDAAYRHSVRRLGEFHMRCLRRIAGIRWQDRVPNTEVLRLCGISGIEAFLLAAQLRWVGHVVRMEDDRIPL